MISRTTTFTKNRRLNGRVLVFQPTSFDVCTKETRTQTKRQTHVRGKPKNVNFACRHRTRARMNKITRKLAAWCQRRRRWSIWASVFLDARRIQSTCEIQTCRSGRSVVNRGDVGINGDCYIYKLGGANVCRWCLTYTLTNFPHEGGVNFFFLYVLVLFFFIK